jgi:hypothetical protein
MSDLRKLKFGKIIKCKSVFMVFDLGLNNTELNKKVYSLSLGEKDPEAEIKYINYENNLELFDALGIKINDLPLAFYYNNGVRIEKISLQCNNI